MIEEIVDDLFMITLPMPFRLGHVHAFLLIHDNKITMFDTGLNTPENLWTLETSLRAINKKVQDVEHIYITHYHIDHCGMAGLIRDISGAEIHMSELSRPFISRSAEEIKLVNDFCLVHGLTQKITENIVEILFDLNDAPSPFQIDRHFLGQQKQRFGDREFEVIPTPGHTHDHVSFFFPQERILIAGDHVLPEITPNLSPDLFVPEFRPLRSFFESLSLVQGLSVINVYPAHGRPFVDLPGRIAELQIHHELRKELTYKSVKRGSKTTSQISQDIFGSVLPAFDQFLALNETYVHLVELICDGLIEETRDETHLLYKPLDTEKRRK